MKNYVELGSVIREFTWSKSAVYFDRNFLFGERRIDTENLQYIY
jgi:hypothetical protein